MRTIIIWLLIVITGGLLRLVFHWIPRLMLQATHSKCSLEEAETVLLVEKFQEKHTSYYVKKLKILTAREVMLVIFSTYLTKILIMKIDTDSRYFSPSSSSAFPLLSNSNNPFDGESLIDNEPWDNESVITIKEDKENHPILSVHLCGGQFKRKPIVLVGLFTS